MLTLWLLAGCDLSLPSAEDFMPSDACPLRYGDADGDGWGDPDVDMRTCSSSEAWVDQAGDCDDDDEDTFPGAEELCDGVDRDCDGRASPAVTWYADGDGDGYGDPEEATHACDEPRGYVGNADDCDDGDDEAHPGAVWYPDEDRDGFGMDVEPLEACEAPSGAWAAEPGDCDDDEAAAHPGRGEACDTIDNDCDGVVDESGAAGEQDFYVDADGDGWGTSSVDRACWRGPDRAEVSGDCDDADATTFPDAPEADCDDPVDHNCDGSVGHEDRDGDGFEACADCDDAAASRNPAASETCDDEDDDCDGEIDEDPTAARAWYPDEDLDGYGTTADPILSCDGGPRLSRYSGDCDDDDPAVNVGAYEACGTAADDDCDGEVNEDDAVGCVSWYPDADGDGWGADEVCTCTITGSTASVGGDCDDAHATANPDGVEVCGTGIDEDCLASLQCGIAGALTESDATVQVVGASGDYLGSAVDDVGDLDGDGLSELIVGASGLDGSVASVGGALVLGAPFSGTLDESDAVAILIGEGSVGTVVAGVGDVDGDGVGDVALGDAWLGDDYGRLYVVTGASLSGELALTDQAWREGLDVDDALGDDVAGPGDVDGDGLADVLVGAPGVGNGGAAYLFAGPLVGSADASDADATLEGAAVGDEAGNAVTGADLDGDGLGDLVVAAWNAGDDGAVYVLHGPVSGSVSLAAADAAVRGGAEDDGLGLAMAVGDTDGDGLMDLALGAPEGGYPSRAGRVHVMTGPFTGESSTDAAVATLAGALPYFYEGIDLELADLDDDGLTDLVSSSNYVSSPTYGGLRVFMAPFSGALDAQPPAATLAGVTYDDFGESVSAAGDTDGDGYGDLWVGATLNDAGGTDAGAAFLFYGGPGH